MLLLLRLFRKFALWFLPQNGLQLCRYWGVRSNNSRGKIDTRRQNCSSIGKTCFTNCCAIIQFEGDCTVLALVAVAARSGTVRCGEILKIVTYEMYINLIKYLYVLSIDNVVIYCLLHVWEPPICGLWVAKCNAANTNPNYFIFCDCITCVLSLVLFLPITIQWQ